MSKLRKSLWLALGLALVVALLATAAPALAAADTPAIPGMPTSGQVIGWSAFQGAPTIPTNTAGYWAWNENVSGQNVLHIRTNSDGNSHKFTGIVSTGVDGNFYAPSPVNADGDDHIVRLSYNQFWFSMLTKNSVEGFDIDWSGRWLGLRLLIDGKARPAQVWYGAGATQAQVLPLAVAAGDKGLLTLSLSLLDGPTPFKRNIADGYYLYRDSDGRMHLRLTTLKKGDVKDYQGTLQLRGGQFGAIRMYRGDARDYYRLLAADQLQFRFITDGYIDGLDWTMGKNATLVLTLRMNGRVAVPNIALGANPFGTVRALTFQLTP